MATLFSSNSFVFYPAIAFGSSLRIALSLVAFTLMAPVIIWIFIPVYARLKCETAYDYLERRYHVSVRCLASGLFILLRIGWMASATFAASVVLAGVSGVSQVTVILALGVVAVLYTLLGGLRAVMWTDVIQFFVFATTILLALLLLLWHTGLSVSEVATTYSSGRDKLLFDFTPSLVLEHGSWAILIGVFLEAVSAFGADQVAVQRYVSARNERTSQIGFGLNLLGMWLVVPGLLAIGVGLYVHFQQQPQELVTVIQEQHKKLPGKVIQKIHADSNPTKNVAASTEKIGEYYKTHPDEVYPDMVAAKLQDQAMPKFVLLHFPPGMIGLFLAALMAAIMSSIDSGIHSVTTAIVVDFRDRLFPQWKPVEESRDLWQIRFLILLIGGTSVTLACFVGNLGDVFAIGKKMTAAFGGPLLAVFVLALFFRRSTTIGVFTGTFVAAGITLYLMYRYDTWYSVWFWPIGFSLALIIALPLSFFGAKSDSALTYWKVMRGSNNMKVKP